MFVLLSMLKCCEFFRIGKISAANVNAKLAPLAAGFGSKSNPVSNAPPLDQNCACGTGKTYGDCCQPFHSKKKVPDDPITTVRSRFSAFVYKITDYIMDTTSTKHKEFVAEEKVSKRKSWKKDLDEYARAYDFLSINFDDDGETAITEGQSVGKVSFRVKMKKAGKNLPPEYIEETSTFVLEGGRWQYQDCVLAGKIMDMSSFELVTPQTKMISTLKKGVPKGN